MNYEVRYITFFIPLSFLPPVSICFTKILKIEVQRQNKLICVGVGNVGQSVAR